MDRWNELIAGFVLGNLTPEEAESIAKILADNPQLASHISRLRNTATVRSSGKTEWSTARSQNGSEGWADTVLDSPKEFAQSTVEQESQSIYCIGSDRPNEKVRTSPSPTFERFSLTEALLVPLFNPLWWAVIALAVAVGIDDFRVRRSLKGVLEELSQLKAAPQYLIQEQPGRVE